MGRYYTLEHMLLQQFFPTPTHVRMSHAAIKELLHQLIRTTSVSEHVKQSEISVQTDELKREGLILAQYYTN